MENSKKKKDNKTKGKKNPVEKESYLCYVLNAANIELWIGHQAVWGHDYSGRGGNQRTKGQQSTKKSH